MEVELGRYLSLQQEVENEEKKFQALTQEKHNQRLQREKRIAKGAKLKAQCSKMYSVAYFTLWCNKSHVVNSNGEHTYKRVKKFYITFYWHSKITYSKDLLL